MAFAIDELPKPELNDPRRVSVDLRDHMRRLIFDNVLQPGDVLKQAALARAFGVSRTPMREAFRMLQEEGIIVVEVDQRAQVRGLDPNELDQLYGVRIALEALGTRLTAGRLDADEVIEAKASLVRLDELKDAHDMDAWMAEHRIFHQLCMARADEPLARVAQSYAERSLRYLRLYQVMHPSSFQISHDEHESILEAVVAGRTHEAGELMAAHLAHTSLTVLADVAPDVLGVATREALAMVSAGRE